MKLKLGEEKWISKCTIGKWSLELNTELSESTASTLNSSVYSLNTPVTKQREYGDIFSIFNQTTTKVSAWLLTD